MGGPIDEPQVERWEEKAEQNRYLTTISSLVYCHQVAEFRCNYDIGITQFYIALLAATANINATMETAPAV